MPKSQVAGEEQTRAQQAQAGGPIHGFRAGLAVFPDHPDPQQRHGQDNPVEGADFGRHMDQTHENRGKGDGGGA